MEDPRLFIPECQSLSEEDRANCPSAGKEIPAVQTSQTMLHATCSQCRVVVVGKEPDETTD